MAPERSLQSRLAAIIDRFSTKSGLEEPETWGRYDIHPRGGRLISIRTPQGTILSVHKDDIIYVRENRDSNKVVLLFT